MKLYEIQKRTPLLLAALLNIWEASVRATHHFLSDADRSAAWHGRIFPWFRSDPDAPHGYSKGSQCAETHGYIPADGRTAHTQCVCEVLSVPEYQTLRPDRSAVK